MDTQQGKVNGIDVQINPNTNQRFQTFISDGDGSEVQVTTSNFVLQSALVLAYFKDVKVEVSFDSNNGMDLKRVRFLDR